MLHLPAVAQLMDHHAVEHFRRREHQQAVEIQIPLAATASSAGALAADRDPSVAHADQRGIVSDALRDDPRCLGCEGANLLRRQFWSSLRRLPLCQDPVSVRFDPDLFSGEPGE